MDHRLDNLADVGRVEELALVCYPQCLQIRTTKTGRMAEQELSSYLATDLMSNVDDCGEQSPCLSEAAAEAAAEAAELGAVDRPAASILGRTADSPNHLQKHQNHHYQAASTSTIYFLRLRSVLLASRLVVSSKPSGVQPEILDCFIYGGGTIIAVKNKNISVNRLISHRR